MTKGYMPHLPSSQRTIFVFISKKNEIALVLATSVIKENLKKTALQREEGNHEFELSPLNKTFYYQDLQTYGS